MPSVHSGSVGAGLPRDSGYRDCLPCAMTLSRGKPAPTEVLFWPIAACRERQLPTHSGHLRMSLSGEGARYGFTSKCQQKTALLHDLSVLGRV